MRKNILPLILLAIAIFLLGTTLFFMLPPGKKLLGQSFFLSDNNGWEIIYKGKTLTSSSDESCVATYTENFNEILVTCSKSGLIQTWKNGVLIEDKK